MNAAETIAAAIEKLEGIKGKATPGPWFVENLDDGQAFVTTDPDIGDYPHVEAHSQVDAELIVTLHRTIDAQLAILRFGVNRQEAVDWTHRLAGDKHREAASLELDLARAILGEPETPRGSIPDPLEGNPYDLIAGEDYEDES